ncbi:TMV resistance protein N-like isoform X2 [Lycium barbarum]|uniref:TMV resistance protein N-like isoform X2 n=1 Tax=Lycium barbarum TaxID=112863 RepID=UPI00293E5F9E|nr:TMV resistance protein N-like isoform X2 [Lycium barbarum]
MASQSKSVKQWKYDTFLNHSEDLSYKYGFVRCFYQRLEEAGISVFQDYDSEIKRGNEVMEGIEESRTAIIIISDNYEEGHRCLVELTKIMECVKSKGQIPITVYYDDNEWNEPRLLSWSTEMFADHDTFGGFSVETALILVASLRNIYNIPRSQLPDGSFGFRHIWEEDKWIQEIVDKILEILGITKYAVGIESRVKEIKSLLKVECGGVSFIGIWGMSGVGKTTAARAIFDEISCQFEGSCFLANVREVSEKHGLSHLRQKLLSQILEQAFVDVASDRAYWPSGILRLKKVIIVLDDVDNTHQLECLVGKRDWFGDGSRIITTTRNTDLLCKHDELYCVPRLARHEALELFSWHTFQQRAPVKEFEELSNCVVDCAEGLPLTLEVVGSCLYRQGMDELRSKLHRLEDFGNRKIVKLLSLSLDVLGDEYRNIFMHIACFFRGRAKRDVIRLMDRLGFDSRIGIHVFTKRSLLYVSNGMIEMRDSIAQMGQQMACDDEQDKPWNCNSSLWHEKYMKADFSASQITRTPTQLMASKNESVRKWKYDAFLSFRGEDTRNNFVAHLYKCLEDRGIETFKDDEKLQRGKFISSELSEAIEESRTAIIIFSENYASSTWCLEELAKIMECADKGQEAIPVFYKVEPSDVRMQRNSFAKALAKHEADLKGADLEKLQRWKDALRNAANIAGWDVRKTANGNEAKCIDQIINNNFPNMHCTISATEKYLVGIEARIGRVESLLGVGSGGVRFLGIWGMGGVGKTTIAGKLYDKISHQFQRSCFLEKVRDESKMNGLMHLQRTLLSRILNVKSVDIQGVRQGASMIKEKLCLRNVLIVFDDVDDEHQLENLVGVPDWYADGSRIIITTRNSDLLRDHSQLYPVSELSKQEALDLFSLHAFQKPSPDIEFLKLSKSVVDYAQGLPLALKVLGSFLNKRGVNVWRSTLDRLKDTGNKDVIEQLRLSLDELTPKDKNIFLDIACFFRGRREDYVKEILKSFGLDPEVGIDVLAKRSLLYISEGRIEMHDLIEQMGQQVARDGEQDMPWNHTRLWHEKDIKTVFFANQAKSVRGIAVPTGIDRHICKFSKAFRKMPCLRLLMVKGDEVRRHDPVAEPIKYLPSSLIWLDWRYYTFESLPANFEPENLVALKMTFSSLVRLCEEPKEFDKLTILNLSFSESLLSTPNFSDIPHLRRVVLKGCVSLVKVDPSIGNLKKLIFLDMENCKSVELLSSGIQMESLESFNLSGCEKLQKFPEIRGKMDLLSELLLGCTAIGELPSSIGHLSGVSLLDLHSCKNLVTLPTEVSEMRKLRILNLKGCSKLDIFPESLVDLQQLEELYAGNTAILQLPDFIRNFSKLEVLSLRRGNKCQFSGSLILPSSFGDLHTLRSLDLSGCCLSGDEVNALILLPNLLELNLSRNEFTSLPDGISLLCRLQYLNITCCQKLKGLPKLPSSIEELYADDFLAKQSTKELQMYLRLNLVSFTSYRFDQPSYKEKSSGSSVLDEIFCLFLSNNMDDVLIPSLNSDHRVSCSIVFPGAAIPTWFKHQSTKQTISFELPNDWYNDEFEGFAICCVTLMGEGFFDPDSGLSGKYDYTFIKAKLTHNNTVLEKECKVGTVSRTYGWCVCFTCIPLYSSLQASGAVDVKNLNQYRLFEASIPGRIVRQWGVQLIYKGNRQFYRSSLQRWNGIQSNFAVL